MSRQVIWTSIVVNEFVELGNLTEIEEQILRTRAKGWSIERQAQELHVSVATVNKAIKRLKQKYDNVQPYSTILKPRCKGAKELFGE